MGLGPGADLAGRGSVGRGSPQDRGSVQVGGSRNMRTLIEVYKNAKPSRRRRVVPPSRESDSECEKFAILLRPVIRRTISTISSRRALFEQDQG